MSKQDTPESLLKRIKDRRNSIRLFVTKLEPKGVLLTNFNIICSAIASVVTAAPAIGGKTLMDAVGATSPELISWRILFAVAALLSLISAIAANMYKSHDMASNLNKAYACDAKLQGLETLLALHLIELKPAATQYIQLLSEVSFISDSSMMINNYSKIDWVRGDISRPHLSQIVDDVTSCCGWVEGVGSNLHIWLSIEIKGRIWPKEGEISVDSDGSWKKVIYEDGATDLFSLSLFVADKKANDRIRDWLDKCDETGDYSRLRRFPGLRRIARVDGLRRKASQQNATGDITPPMNSSLP